MQFVDPQVSRRKFAASLAHFLEVEATQHQRGIFLLKAEYPDMVFMFMAPKLRPIPILFAVRINFDNFDLQALSVRFVDPLSWEPLQQPPISLLRKVAPFQPFSNQELVVKEATGLPFVCLPGIREYHQHPAHTGDAWLLHRDIGGEGSLGFILDKLYEYGVVAVAGYQIQAQSPTVMISLDPNLIPT